MQIAPFVCENSPLQWVLEPVDLKYVSLSNRLERFLENWKWDKKFRCWEHKEVNEFHLRNWIIALVTDGFYFQIERAYDSMFGPHTVMLMYRSDQHRDQFTWVATCQLNAMWAVDERMQAALTAAIEAGELFQSEKSGKTLVLL